MILTYQCNGELCREPLIGDSDIDNEEVKCPKCGKVNIFPAIPQAPRATAPDETLTLSERITNIRKKVLGGASHDPLYRAHSAAILLLLDIVEQLLPLIEVDEKPQGYMSKPYHQLKSECSKRNLAATGSKEDLVARLEADDAKR